MNENLAQLTEELSKIGLVEVIKNDYVFTLYMVNDTLFLNQDRIPFKVMDLVTQYIGDEKPNIEVFKNDSNFILIVLKP